MDPAILISAGALVVSAAAFVEARRSNRRREQAHLVVDALGASGDGMNSDNVRVRLKNIGGSSAVGVRVQVRAKGARSDWTPRKRTIEPDEEYTFNVDLPAMTVVTEPSARGARRRDGRWLFPPGAVLEASFEDRRGERRQRIKLEGEEGSGGDLLPFVLTV